MGFFTKDEIQYAGYARVVAEIPLNSCYNKYFIRRAGTDEHFTVTLKAEKGHACDLDFIKSGDLIKIEQTSDYDAVILENQTLSEEIIAARNEFIQHQREAHASGTDGKTYVVVRSAMFNHELRDPSFLLINKNDLIVGNFNTGITYCTNQGDIVVCKPEDSKYPHNGKLHMLKNISYEHRQECFKQSELAITNTIGL